MKSSPSQTRCAAFTLLEIMVGITIVGLLAIMSFPAYNSIKTAAYDAVTTNNLKQLVNATIMWAGEHSDKLPSPVYPGGHQGDLPEYHDLGLGTGLWLDGVVFAAVYMEEDVRNLEAWNPTGAPSAGIEAGAHLVGTVFESKASAKKMSQDRNWYHHAFAMNANLQYDEINETSPDPWLTEKNYAKFELPRAMLFVDCFEKNVVKAEDQSLLVDTADMLYGGKYVITAFLDGSIEKIKPKEIPSGDVNTERESSLYWRGVSED